MRDNQNTFLPLPEPDLYAHELILNGGGVWLGCHKKGICEQAYEEGETGEEVREYYTTQQVLDYTESCVNHIKKTLENVLDVLDSSKSGLEWYQDMHPEHYSSEDDEMKNDIVSSMLQLKLILGALNPNNNSVILRLNSEHLIEGQSVMDQNANLWQLIRKKS